MSAKSLAVSPSRSAMSSPASPGFKGATIRPLTGQSVQPSERSLAAPKCTETSSHQTDGSLPPPTPGITAIPPFPPSPKESATSKHQREASKSFFSSFKSSKSSHRTLPSDVSSSHISEKPVSRGSSRDRSVYRYARSHNTSSPDLPSTSENSDIKEEVNSNNDSLRDNKADINGPGQKLSTKKSKPRFANLLTRTRSIRHDEQSLPSRPSTARRPSNGLMRLEEHSNSESQEPLRTAPLQNERAFREAMDSTIRNRSADRPPTNDGSAQLRKERSYGGSGLPTSITSSSLFNNIKQTSSGATKSLGRAGKGFLGKFRGNHISEQNVINDDNYVCKVINLPLVEQCRKTRISKRLQDSKDKTEYWMPALPWRCIDFLNFKGCEEEGLYRVPGSGRDVKHWQRRFDTELDIDLFEQPDLYDINTVGSMFKAWLRELPDEIFPLETQKRIQEECEGATKVPQILKDELSKLPPFHYYLLFAITCHLSLLHSYVDKNKMDYRNLCICFQPCMKIDAFCFNFLVCHWRDCWQGCWTEKEYLDIELEVEKKAKEEEEVMRQKKLHEQQLMYTKTLGMTSPIQEQAPWSKGFHRDASNASSTTSGKKPVSRGRDKPGANANGDGKKSIEKHNSRSSSLPKKGRKKSPPGNIDSVHSRSASQLPELGPPLSPIQI